MPVMYNKLRFGTLPISWTERLFVGVARTYSGMAAVLENGLSQQPQSLLKHESTTSPH